MKLGVHYNIFDGEELLEKSILSVRDHVDYIFVVFQEISNYGNKGNPKAVELLDDLFSRKLIDGCYYDFKPDLNLSPHENEVRKRNLGLIECRRNGCSHVLGMDADEFYVGSEFIEAKEKIEREFFDSSACKMWTYFKSPTYRIQPPEKYHVPFIQKIFPSSQYILHHSFPVLVDPTRRLNNRNDSFHLFRPSFKMHHMSFVRKDIRSKIMNSSAKVNFKDPEGYVRYFEKWEPGMKNFHPANPKEFHDIEIVENIFDIDV